MSRKRWASSEEDAESHSSSYEQEYEFSPRRGKKKSSSNSNSNTHIDRNRSRGSTSDDSASEYEEEQPAGKRAKSNHGETNLSDDDNRSMATSRSSTSFVTRFSSKDDAANKIAIATARVMLGLANRNQVLNKSIISKILETENEKGSGLQFRKNVLPILTKLVREIFNYEVVELPSKKSTSTQANSDKNNDDTQTQPHAREPASDEFILVNNIPPSLRALNYTFMVKYTTPIQTSLKSMEAKKSTNPTTVIYGEHLPKPTINVIQNGIKLLIICIVILHNNNILQSDLITILKTNFGLKFREKEVVSILGDQTLDDFITMLSRQDYLDRNLIATSNNKTGSISRRSVNSKNVKHDDTTVVIKLGRRCVSEWSMEEFVGLFHQLMQDQWTEQLQESAIFTVSSLWKQ